MQKTITISSNKREDLLDITEPVQTIITESGIKNGICNIYVPHATSGVIINENADPNIIDDFLDVLRRLAPRGTFRHDRIDGNGDAHIKSALVGAGESIPFRDGQLQLGTWQSIMVCEFDGPRQGRQVHITLLEDRTSGSPA